MFLSTFCQDRASVEEVSYDTMLTVKGKMSEICEFDYEKGFTALDLG